VIDNKNVRKDKNKEVALDDQLLIAEEQTNLVVEKHVHKPGEVVEVLPRTWPGMNKPGGIAWILSIHDGSIEGSIEKYKMYDVKYILNGNQDHNIPDYFIRPHEELERRSRKRGISPVAIPAHSTVTSVKNPNISQNNKKNKNIVTSIDKSVDFGLESNAIKSDKRCSICLTQVFISFKIRKIIFFTYALFIFFV
jgi:hypothetical protein